MKWSRDGTRLASSSNSVRIWTAAGQPQHTLHHTPSGIGLAWSPDGEQLATAGLFAVRLWDTRTGEELKEPPDRAVGSVDCLVWSPDGREIACVDGYLKMLNPPDRTVLARVYSSGQNHFQAMAYAPDGVTFVTAAVTLRLWDARTRKPQKKDLFRGHKTWINRVAWSPDGNQLASASDDKTVRVWDVATATLVHTLVHPERVEDVAWSPDSKQLASGSHDDRLRLWNASTGQLDLEIQDHKDGVLSLAWSPHGQLATGHLDGTIRLWNLARTLASPGEIVRIARERTGLVVNGLDVVPAPRAKKN